MTIADRAPATAPWSERSRRLLGPFVGEPPVHFAVVDVETTGLEPESNRVIEIAIVEVDRYGSVIDEFASLVDVPGCDELGAGFVHGITRSMLRGAPTFAQLIPAICERLAGRVVVGHVVDFDLSHLRAEFDRAGVELPDIAGGALCTKFLSSSFLPEGSRALLSCCSAFGIEVRDHHSALGDARAAAELLVELLDLDEPDGLDTTAGVASRIAWPSASPLSTISMPRPLGPEGALLRLA